MRAKIAAVIVMALVFSSLTAHAAESSTNSGVVVLPDSKAPSFTATLRPSGSHSPDTDPTLIEETTAQDCEGKAPSSGSVTALLSRLIASSHAVRGVQCPIPPVPNQSRRQETRP